MVRHVVRHLPRACARYARPLTVLALLALALLPAGRLAAQEEHQNLQVLPKDISRERLGAIMRGFTGALGVRCSTCHVGEEGLPLSTYDFASDDKAMKLKAREMLKMVSAINGEYLANLPQRHDPATNVTCATCHRGVRRPEPIEAIVQQTLQAEDLDFAIQRYRELRDEYYGSASYDFSDRPLVGLAQSLGRDDPASAMRLLELNLEYHPQSAATLNAMGGVAEAQGDKAAALGYYKKVLEIQPDNERAQQKVKELGG